MDEQIRNYQKILKNNPTDIPAFTALEEIFRGIEAWRDLVKLFEDRIKILEDPELKIALIEKCVSIWHHKIGDLTKALSYYEQILRFNPVHIGALKGLEDVFTQRSEWVKLTDVLEQLAVLTEDSLARSSIYRRLGGLYQDTLKRRDKALVAWGHALAANPKMRDVLNLMRESYRELGYFNKVLELLDQEAKQPDSDNLYLGEKYLQLGQKLLEEPLFEEACRTSLQKAKKLLPDATQVDRALEALEKSRDKWDDQIKMLRVEAVEAPDKSQAVSLYRRIAEIFFLQGEHDTQVEENINKCTLLQPDNTRVLGFMERYYLSKNRPRDLIQRLEELLTRVRDRTVSIAILEKIGMYASVYLQDKKSAARAYHRILEIEPGHPSAVASLVESFQDEGRWVEVVELLRAQADRQSDLRARLDIVLQIAEITANQLKDPDAARFLYEEVLRLDEYNLRVALALSSTYEKSENWTGLIRCLEIQIHHEQDKTARTKLLEKIAEIYLEHSNDPAGAFHTELRSLAINPGRKKTLQSVLSLGEQTGRFQELSAALRSALDSGEYKGKGLIALLNPLAVIYETKLNNNAEAIKTYQRIIEHDPKNMPALDALERLQALSGGSVELVTIYRQQIDLVQSGEKKKELLFKLSSIYRDRMADFGKAIATFKEILKIDDKDGIAWTQLAELHEREGQWKEAAEALEKSIGYTGDPVGLMHLKYRLAGIYEQRLNDTTKALKLCNDILATEQIEPEVAAGVVNILERLQSRGVNAMRIAEILQPYYALAGDWRRHIDMIELRLEGAGSPDERIQLLERIGQVYEEKLVQKEWAFSAYGRAFREAPDREELRVHLTRLAQETGHLEDLAAYLEEAVGRTKNKKLIISLSRSLGDLYHKQLNRPRQAVASFRRLLQFEPGSDDALQSLAELYRVMQEWGELANILKLRLQLVEEVEQRKVLLLELAQVTDEELHDRPAAIEVLQQMQKLSESDLGVLRRLDVLLEKEGRWQDLAGILEKEIPLVSAETASDLKLRLGRVQAERMEDRENALEYYRQVITANPDDPRAIQALESLLGRPDSAPMAAELLRPIYEKMNNWAGLALTLGVRAEALKEPRQKVDTLLKVAELYEQRLNQKDRAFAALRKAFGADSSRRDVLKYMERLAEKSGAYEELTAALEDAVGTQQEPAELVFLLQTLAGLYRDRFRRPELAATRLRRLLEIDPKHTQALGALEVLYREAKSLQDLTWVLSKQAELATDPDKRRDIFTQVAQIREDELGDIDGAIEAFSRVFESDPEDIHAAKQLDRLYQLTGRWEEDAALLPKLASLSKNVLGVIDYNTRLASIYTTQLNDPRQAIQIYRRILEIKPNYPDTIKNIENLLKDERCRLGAAEVLEGVYRSMSEWRKLAAILEMRLAASPEPAQRLKFYSQLREIYETKIEEKALAFNVAARAFREQPQDEGVLKDLLRMSAEGGFFEELVNVLLDVVERHVGTDLATNLRKQVAWIYERYLGQRTEAIEQWEKLIESHPYDPEVLSALERLYREEGNFAALVKVYRSQIDLTEDMEKKKDLLFRTGACLSEVMEDLDGAIQVYQALLAMDPADRRAMKMLGGLYQSSERWKELAETIEREIELVPEGRPPEGQEDVRLDLLLRKADIHLNHLGNTDEGMAALREALMRNVSETRTIGMLEQLLPHEATRQTAAELLEPVYRAQGDYKKLVAIVGVRLAAKSDKKERLTVSRELMTIYEEQLNQKPVAFTVACQAFRENFDDEGIRKELERLASQTGLFEELAGVYEEISGKTEGTEVGPIISRRLAQLKETYLEEKDEAVSQWRQVLASNPEDPEALKALERLYRERGAYAELVGILRHMAELENDSDKKKDLYHEVATLMEERLGNNAGAIDAYREILAIDSQDLAVLKLVDRLLEKERRWEELKQVLSIEIERATESELIALQLRLAHMLRAFLSSPAEAVKIYAAVLQRDSAQKDALRALVEMFDASDARDLAARVLVNYLEAFGDWKRLITALELIVNSSEEAAQRKAVLTRMAVVYEGRLAQKELAFTTLGRAFKEDPCDDNIRLGLERLASETDSYDVLAAIYQAVLVDVEEKQVLLTLQRRLASLYEERLGDPERAIEHLRAVSNLDSKDAVSLIALENVFRQQHRYDELVDILRKRAALTANPEESTAIMYEIATIHEEQLGDLGGAISAYREVLEKNPQDLNALRMMDRLCSKQGRNKDLIDVLIAEIKILDSAGDNSESLDVRYRLAHLIEQEFGDFKKAASLYNEILKRDPAHPKTVEYLESLLTEGRSFEGSMILLEAAYEQSGDWKKYVDVLSAQVRQSRVMARRMELLGKIAEVQEHKMGLKTLAFNTYVRMFHEDVANAGVRTQMERIAFEDENLEALTAVYEEELDNIEDPQVGVAVAIKVAEIQDAELQDKPEAVRFYNAALRYDPKNLQVFRSLDRLYAELERWEELVEVLSKELDLVEDREEKVQILFRLGKVCYERVNQASKAVGYFRQVVEIDPMHAESMRMLERAFTELGDYEALYGVLTVQLQQAQNQHERIELAIRLADLASEQMKRPDEAIELWKEVLEVKEYGVDAYEALDRLYEQTERWSELAQLVEYQMGRTSDQEKIAALSSRLGWVKEEKLGKHEEAMGHYKEVLRLDPKDQNALQHLRQIYRSTGQWEDLIAILRKLVPLQEDMNGVKALRFELAEVIGEKLGRKEEAIEAAKRALDIEPHSLQDLVRLSKIFQSNEAWQDAVSVLEQGAELKDVGQDKIDALLEVASLWKDKIGRPLGATQAYERILEIDPFHEEAFRTAERIFRDNKEWRRLTALLEKRLAQIRERKDRVNLIKEIAQIYETNLGQKDLAFARYCAAFREDFSDDSVLVRLEEIAQEKEDYDTLLEVLEDATEEVTAGPRAVSLYKKIADIYRLRLRDLEKAEASLLKAVDLDRRDMDALNGLAEVYQEQERWPDLQDVLERKYERSDNLEGRKEIRRQLAILQEERLGRPDLAMDSYRRILELDGRDGLAIQSLLKLYQREGQWQELIQVLRRAADQAQEKSEAVSYRFHIASIYETELSMDEDAIEAYQEVLTVDPFHTESLRALERIYTRLDRWSELLQVFEKEVSLQQDLEEKAKLYNKMASIWEERFARLEQAAACHENILQFDPQNLYSVKSLERLVRRMGDFKRLIELYYRHIDLIHDRSEIVDIHLAIGEVWYRELSRVDKAEEVFNKALQIDGQSRQAIHALGQLYEKSGNWFTAIEMLKKEAELSGASSEAVDLYYRMGKINEDMLLDSHAARDAYTKALAIEPSYLPAIKALKLIYYLEKNFDQYLEMMIQEAEHTEDMEEKTRLFFEIGKFLQEQREDSNQALAYYEQALRLTPDYLPAAKPLADIYFRTEQWDRAEEMMEIVVNGLDRNNEAKELCRQYYRLGYITERLGKEEKALEHYRTSYDLDATYLPALEGLGNALIKNELWEEAYRIYQTILIHHRDSLSDAEVAELYQQIGDINYHMGEIDRAIGSFKKALEIDRGHVASLQYLVRIHEEQERWEDAYDYGMQLVDSMGEEELFEHYLHLGQLCREKLQDAFRAMDVLQGALRLRPDNQDVLSRLLELYIETRQYPKAADALEQIVQIEKNPRKLVEYHKQAAQLKLEELNDELGAVEHYNAALDIDQSSIQGFQKIVEILRKRKDWEALKTNHIKMIKRLPIEARKTKLALWKDLGSLCLSLHSLTESIDAYRMIVTLDPNDIEAQATLGELLEKTKKPENINESIAIHHKVINVSVNRVESYRSLWKRYNEKKEYDKVYCIAIVLRYLKKADEEEQKIYNYFSRKAPQVASRPLSDKAWETMLAHQDVKIPFTRIFHLLYNKAPSMFIKDHKDVNLRKKEQQVDLARDRSLFGHNFRIAAKVLGGIDVELFGIRDQDGPHPPGLNIELTKPTAVIAYRSMFAEDKKKHLLFYIGRILAMTRPEFILPSVLPVRELDNLLQACCGLMDGNFKPEGDVRGIERARGWLKRALSEEGISMLKRPVLEYLKESKKYNLRRWVEAVEHCVNRAGLVVCNDLPIALDILGGEQSWLTPMRPAQKVRELLLYASSPEYFQLRETIGLGVS